MEYNKLVRDNIPEIIRSKGEKAITHIAEDHEYKEALVKKLHEEVGEFIKNISVEEATDILEVIHAMCALSGVDLKNLEEARLRKAEKRGGFSKKIILDRTE